MAKYGIKIKSIEEEEYCLIPMGGVLPRLPQRVLGIGGTAGMVHPSTGDPPQLAAQLRVLVISHLILAICRIPKQQYTGLDSEEIVMSWA